MISVISFVFFLFFFVCLSLKYLGNGWTDLCQIYSEVVFGPSSDEFECPGQRSRSPGTKKNALSADTPRLCTNGMTSLQTACSSSGWHHLVPAGVILVSCMQCMFGIMSLALDLFFFVFFCLWINYLGNRWTDLRQVHSEDVFGPSLGRVWMSRSKIKVTRDKNALCTSITHSSDGMERSRCK